MITPAQRDKLAQRLALPASGADDGRADPALARALALPDGPRRTREVTVALARARVLLPVYPHPHPAAQKPQAGAGLVTVALGARRAGLACYASMDALAAARPDARPQPLAGQRLALAALAGEGRIVIDDAVIVPRPAVAALAQGDDWLPAWCDGELARLALARVADLGVVDVRLEWAPLARDRVLLRLDEDVDASRARDVVAAASSRLAGLARLVVACDAIEIVPTR